MRKKVAVVSIIICLLIIMIPDRVKETPQVEKQATNVQATDINTTATVKEEEKNQDEKLTLSINDLIQNEKVMQTTDKRVYNLSSIDSVTKSLVENDKVSNLNKTKNGNIQYCIRPEGFPGKYIPHDLWFYIPPHPSGTAPLPQHCRGTSLTASCECNHFELL